MAQSMLSSSSCFVVRGLGFSLQGKGIHSPSKLQVRCCSSDKHQHQQHNSIEEEEKKIWDGKRAARATVAVIAAGVLIVGSCGDAMAAKSGGRVGGQAFSSSPPPRTSNRINNSRANVYINPPTAPPLFGGYGYGSPFFGGWGWSPFSLVPGPSAAIGFGGGFDFFFTILLLGIVGRAISNFFRRDEDDFDD